MESSIVTILAFIGVIAFGLVLGFVVPRLSRRWDVYSDRVGIKTKQRKARWLNRKVTHFRGGGHYPKSHTISGDQWDAYRGRTLGPFAKIIFSDDGLVFRAPGYEHTYEYSQLTGVSLARSGFLTFYTPTPADDFSIKSASLRDIIDALKNRGVPVTHITNRQVTNALLVVALPYLIIFLPPYLWFLLSSENTPTYIVLQFLYPIAILLSNISGPARTGDDKTSPDDTNDDW